MKVLIILNGIRVIQSGTVDGRILLITLDRRNGGIVITEPYKTKKDDKYIIGMYHDNRDNIRIYTNLSYKDSKEFNKLLDRLEKVTTDDYYKTTLSIAKLPIGSIVDRQRSNISEDITHQYPFDEWIDKLTK